MRGRISRRAFLGASAGAALAPVGADLAAATGACETYREERDALEAERDHLADLERERDRLDEAIASLQSTVAAGRDAARGDHPYDAAVREEARAVGLEARPGMAFLEMTDDISVTTASAWFVDEHLLLTNNHNVSDLTPETERTFWTIDGERHTFEVVGRSEQGADIALLRTDASAPKVLPTGSSTSVEPGDRLVQVGNPGGFGQWVLTLGELVEHRESWTDFVTTVPGLQGVSGSPVVDMGGQVVGVTYAGQPHSDWEPGQRPEPSSTDVVTYPLVPDSDGLHVPIEAALELMEEWT
ncbi:MAG: serine protease [Halobacteriales archaeon]|nr:serine protease [Halobacteriales archaeon]